MTETAYYVTRKRKLLKNLAKGTRLLRPELVARYGDETSHRILRDTQTEFETLLPQLPYVGGNASMPALSTYPHLPCSLTGASPSLKDQASSN